MLKTAGITFGSKLGAALINFGLIIAISQLLGPSERGQCALYLLILTLTAAISDVMAGAASSYLVQTYKPQTIYRLHALWAMAPSFAIPLIWLISGGLSFAETAVIILAGWVHSRYNLQQHLLLALHQFNRFNANGILFPLTASILFLFFWKLGIQSGYGYLLAVSLGWGLLFLSNHYFFQVFLAAHPLQSGQEPATKDLLMPGLINQSSHLVSILNNRLIFFILPAIQLGLWSNVLTIAEAVFMIPGSLGQIMYALLSDKNAPNAKNIFKKAFYSNLILTAFAVGVLAILPEEVWLFLFGKPFEGIRNLLLMFLPGIGMYAVFLLITYRQSSLGRFSWNLYPLLFGFVVNAVITLWFWMQGSYHLEKGVQALTVAWMATALSSLWIQFSGNPKKA